MAVLRGGAIRTQLTPRSFVNLFTPLCSSSRSLTIAADCIGKSVTSLCLYRVQVNRCWAYIELYSRFEEILIKCVCVRF